MSERSLNFPIRPGAGIASLTAISLSRPVAVLMCYLGLVLLGIFAWSKMPVELIPSLEGEQLLVRFSQVGASADSLEREILIPLEKQSRRLSGVVETRGEIEGDSGNLEIVFEAGVDLKVRALALQNAVADLRRRQPEGTTIELGSQNFSALSRFVMSLQVTGGGDLSSLRAVVEARVRDALVAIPGVSRALVVGAGESEVAIELDIERCTELRLAPADVVWSLESSLRGLRLLGNYYSFDRQQRVLLDTRIADLDALRNVIVDQERGIRLRHVAKVSIANKIKQGIFRVDGRESIGILIFKGEGANLVATGQALNERLGRLNRELRPFGLAIHRSFDASALVAKVLDRLKILALAGFAIALFVLYAFLHDIRAVATVAVAVPISVLVAGALLHLSGHSLNIITLFGLSIGIGMLVDNSVVVYEAVNRGLERGMTPQRAALTGIQRTMKAIVAATLTNAVVLLPLVMFVDDAMIRQLVTVISAAILLPLLASLLVAATLVPLLAREFARELAKAAPTEPGPNTQLRRPGSTSGVRLQRTFDPGREFFAALLKVSLRDPTAWALRLAIVIVLTLSVAAPVVLLRSAAAPAPDASEVKVELALGGGSTLETASLVFARLEQLVAEQPGVTKTESHFFEDEGSLTVYLADSDGRPGQPRAAAVRRAIADAVREMKNVQINTEDDRPSAISLDFGSGDDARIAVSGPDMAKLSEMANFLAAKLEARPEIAGVSISSTAGPADLRLGVDRLAAMFYGLDSAKILTSLHMAGREGQVLKATYSAADGRELPISLHQTNRAGIESLDKLRHYSVSTPDGPIPLDNVLESAQREPLPAISHRNGRRELSVHYRFADNIGSIDPQLRQRLVDDLVARVFTPSGYTLVHHSAEAQVGKFSRVFLPVFVLLVVVLALTFESLTLPFLILLSVPMTLIGGLWGLFFGGFGLELMALVGVIVLFGLAVNPAILLIERIQQTMRRGFHSAGAAVMMAVRERARPMLVTAGTTIGGLWPMTLVTGKEMEIWPAFAVVLMGGVAMSTVLTLLIIPVAYVYVDRFDRRALSMSRRQWMLWAVISAGMVALLIAQDYTTHTSWFVFVSLLIVVFVFVGVTRLGPRSLPEASATGAANRALSMESRYIAKTYDQPGPLAQTWRRYRRTRELIVVSTRKQVELGVVQLLLSLAAFYLANHLYSPFWRLVFTYLAGVGLLSGAMSFYSIYAPRGRRALSPKLMLALPWLVLVYVSITEWGLPLLTSTVPGISAPSLLLLAVLTLLLQQGRSCALAIAQGRLEPKTQGRWQWLRNSWRRFSSHWLGADIRQPGFTALSNINFKVEPGMIGLLGPNGAGKSTFLRIVASILDPSTGTLRFYDRDRRAWGADLAAMIGYLPQEFGLYNHMSAREYLDYFAVLYRVGDQHERRQRVDDLLREVGLESKQHEKLGGFSGGMRQRAAVARTLLRLPPILVVDEPTVGLDSRERIRFRNLLAKLAGKRIVLFSTHVVEDVAISCHRTLVLRAGEILYDGSPQQLADFAKDAVWTVRLPESELREISHKGKVVTQISEGGGIVRLRLLSSHKPYPDATMEPPTLEDGYLCLLGKRETA